MSIERFNIYADDKPLACVEGIHAVIAVGKMFADDERFITMRVDGGQCVYLLLGNTIAQIDL